MTREQIQEMVDDYMDSDESRGHFVDRLMVAIAQDPRTLPPTHQPQMTLRDAFAQSWTMPEYMTGDLDSRTNGNVKKYFEIESFLRYQYADAMLAERCRQ